MKTVFSNYSEVCHIWAHQSQEEARSSNVFFRNELIYSYGHHFCMGRILRLADTVILTNRGYSNTTAKHLSAVRYSVNHYKNIVRCYDPSKNVTENLIDIYAQLRAQFNIVTSKKKIRNNTRENAKVAIGGIIRNSLEYFAAMHTTEAKALKEATRSGKQSGNMADCYREFVVYWNAAKLMDIEGLNKQLANAEKKANAAKKREQQRRDKANADNIAAWIAGSGHYAVIQAMQHYVSGVYLRIDDGLHSDGKKCIETSKGARVSLKAAKVLFGMIKAGKDIKGFDIDGYTVISLNGVLTIGCHEITRQEINRFAASQNWGQIELH